VNLGAVPIYKKNEMSAKDETELEAASDDPDEI
jgi:hypothetical protein